MNEKWIIGEIETDVGSVPLLATRLTVHDTLSRWIVRWGVGRNGFMVEPGLYAVGQPDVQSPVIVTANYKMSFDCVRQSLDGRNAWMLVLDTKGVNVWCAAGKGSFGTHELLDRISATKLKILLPKAILVLPQLCASGVSVKDVKKKSGFKVVYGPVRADDLPAFLDSDMNATEEMRRVRFGYIDRLILVPVELVISLRYVMAVIVGILILSGIGEGGYSMSRILSDGWRSSFAVIAAWLAGAFVGPFLLPILPGRAFSLKGAGAGLMTVVLFLILGPGIKMQLIEQTAWLLIVPAVASFMVMNFTGASTFTSPSGVRKEMKTAVPLQAVGATGGVVLWVVHLFV